jgi:hypothetical protein
MTLSVLGRLSVGGILPEEASLLAGILPDLQGRLAGALGLSGSVEVELPTLQAKLDAAGTIIAEVQAEIALSGPAAKVSFQAMADIIAELRAEIALILELQLALGGAGIYVFSYDGTAADLSAELGAQTDGGLPDCGPDDHVNALILATSVPAAWVALGKFLVH